MGALNLVYEGNVESRKISPRGQTLEQEIVFCYQIMDMVGAPLRRFLKRPRSDLV